MKLATFRCDITPPIGAPLCGGWIAPAARVEDPQSAVGVVLAEIDSGPPVVLCALDWCELRNGAFERWRAALAAAVGTTADRVAVPCTHPHDAFFVDEEAQDLMDAAGVRHVMYDRAFFATAVERAASAAREALARLVPVTHIGAGQARVEQVASNRRVMGSDGKVRGSRWSACRDPELRAAPEGLIDPFAKTVSFWDGDRLLTALHFYATHPQSHYGQGAVSCDFPALARDRVAQETGAPQIYFTGAAGNVTAGKYNDGAPENREVLTARLDSGLRAALAASGPVGSRQSAVGSPDGGNTTSSEDTPSPLPTADCRLPTGPCAWRTVPLRLPTKADLSEPVFRELLHNPERPPAERTRAAMRLAWLGRADRPIDVGCLALGDLRLLFLPGEPFVEFQLFAQQTAPERFVAVAGYGDCGPGYVCTDAAFAEGGYESGSPALVGPGTEAALKEAITMLLA